MPSKAIFRRATQFMILWEAAFFCQHDFYCVHRNLFFSIWWICGCHTVFYVVCEVDPKTAEGSMCNILLDAVRLFAFTVQMISFLCTMNWFQVSSLLHWFSLGNIFYMSCWKIPLHMRGGYIVNRNKTEQCSWVWETKPSIFILPY